ncbi:MAG TPA: MarR family transcriptional regulator [Rhizomicrobium sp.]|nr:MarR family transcriptional regulator [Rhizomicrobium sp.]
MKKSKPASVPDATRGHGAAAIGGRLRRLSESIDQDCARIYAENGIKFEQRWLGVLSQLAWEGPQSVGRLAASLGISHASVSQTRKSMEKAGLIRSKADANDARSQTLRLSAEGKRLFSRLSQILESLKAVSVELNEEAGQPLEALERLDDALSRRSLYERYQTRS